MKLKAMTVTLFAAGLLAGLTLIAPATGADPPTTTSGSTTSATTTTTSTTSSTPTTTTTSTTTTTPTSYTSATDPISALNSTSLTVGSLSCSLGSSSPAVTFKVGDRVRIYCANGVLAYIFAADPPPPTTTTTTTPTNYTTATDATSAPSSTSPTVGQLTCSIGSSSPAVTFKIGDRVRMYCANGVLAYIKADTPPPTTTTTQQIVTHGGILTALGTSSITVDSLTCTLNSSSPSLTGFKVGDHVGVACAAGVLIKIVSLSESDGEQSMATKSGPIVALSATSITVGDLTCTLASSSPSLAGLKVGDPLGIGCISGVLVKIATPSIGDHHDDLTTRMGTISALSSTSITVADLTCAINASSPSVAFKVGDQVGVGCANGVLIKIGVPHGDDGELTTRLGTISALSSTSITVDGLTCTVGASSPSLAGFNLGDQVGIGCANGVLVKIGTPQGDGHGFKVAVQLGPIAAVSTSSITVGQLTCSLATTSPNVSSYNVGDRVGIGCAGGILFMIGALPSSNSLPNTEIQHALVQRFHSCIKHGSEHCSVKGILRRLVRT